MTTIEIKPNTRVELDAVLNGVSALDTHELQDFLQQVAQVLAERKAPHYSRAESELLKKVNKGYPESVKQRFEYLRDKQTSMELSTGEEQELFAITDQFEAWDAERLQALMELSVLKHVGVEQILEQLKQPSPSTHA